MSNDNNVKITLLHIASTGRSGSTLMERILNEVPGIFAAGEIGVRGDLFREDGRCFCGQRFEECPVWGKIIKDNTVIKKTDRNTLLERLQKYNCLLPFLRLLLTKPDHWPEDFKQYLQTLQAIYASIHKHQTCQVITDSTACFIYGYYLSLLRVVDLYVVHLVRSPWGYVHSCSIPKYTSKQVQWSTGKSPLLSAFTWLKKNLLLEIIAFKHKRKYLRIRYEDFIENPIEIINDIGRILNLNLETSFIKGNTLSVGVNHLSSGNIDALIDNRGEKEIILKPDDRWKRDMKWWNILIVTLITWPLLLRYYVFSKKIKNKQLNSPSS